MAAPAIRLKTRSAVRAMILSASLVGLTACQGALDGLSSGRENAPVPAKLVKKMKAKGMALTSPIMIRIFKEENVLEVWKQTASGRYALLTEHEICKWSGRLGPKFKEGDRQAPEGFYSVNKHQMNPNSQYHLSFNIGFPNAYDRSHGRTGTHLMVHGACSSAGCYSMTDEQVEVIYALARDAFKGGQQSFQLQAYPFRMTAENMVKNRDSEHFKFWEMLKVGYDHFELTRVPPKVDVCERRYEFNTDSGARYPSSGSCPARKMPLGLATSYVRNQSEYALKFEKLLAREEGRDPVALSPITFASALPGITVEGAQPVAVTPGDSAKPAAAVEPAGQKPAQEAVPAAVPATTGSLEKPLRPAG